MDAMIWKHFYQDNSHGREGTATVHLYCGCVLLYMWSVTQDGRHARLAIFLGNKLAGFASVQGYYAMRMHDNCCVQTSD